MSHAKLVRDRVPQIIRDRGAEPVTWVADAEEYRGLLRAKLVEEVEEFLASDDPNELADVLEVLLALAGDLGLDRDQLEKLRAAKALERGGFADRMVWAGNAPTMGGGVVATDLDRREQAVGDGGEVANGLEVVNGLAE